MDNTQNLSNDTGFEDCKAASSSSCSSSTAPDSHNNENYTVYTEDDLRNRSESDSSYDFEQKCCYESRLSSLQPLYQIYMMEEQEKVLTEPSFIKELKSKIILEENESDSICDSNEVFETGSVSIYRQGSSASTDSGRGADVVSRNVSDNSMRRERLTAGSVYGSQRSLWCELPEVRSAGLLDTLDISSKKLQEAYFEVITSEASYLRSINILISHFMASPELQGPKKAISVVTNAERKCLFSNILAIRDCTET